MYKTILLAVVLAPCAASAREPEPQQVTITALRDQEWASYRHAYKVAAMYETHTRSRPLIQAHMQIRPLQDGLSLEGLRVVLSGATTNIDIPVDAFGRATVPMLKKAYDEDAVLRLNRRKGNYRFSGRYTIRERDDGVYPAADLRAACEQLLGAQRDSGNRFRLLGKACVGVKFIYPLADAGAAIDFRDPLGKSSAIAAVDEQPFESVPMGLYKTATYRFSAWPAQGELVALRRPLAIVSMYE